MAVVHDMLKNTPLRDIIGYFIDLNDMKRITAMTATMRNASSEYVWLLWFFSSITPDVRPPTMSELLSLRPETKLIALVEYGS